MKTRYRRIIFNYRVTGENAQFDLINCRYSYLRKKRFLFLTVYYF